MLNTKKKMMNPGMFVSTATAITLMTSPFYGEAGAEPHTTAAVIADDKAWSKAEENGDVDYLDHFLLPEYRSVDSMGTIKNKTAILASAKADPNNKGQTAKDDQWSRSHPSIASVSINGDTAILTFTLDRGNDPKPVISTDIYVYRKGRWKALYSQHTDASR